MVAFCEAVFGDRVGADAKENSLQVLRHRPRDNFHRHVSGLVLHGVVVALEINVVLRVEAFSSLDGVEQIIEKEDR